MGIGAFPTTALDSFTLQYLLLVRLCQCTVLKEAAFFLRSYPPKVINDLKLLSWMDMENVLEVVDPVLMRLKMSSASVPWFVGDRPMMPSACMPCARLFDT